MIITGAALAGTAFSQTGNDIVLDGTSNVSDMKRLVIYSVDRYFKDTKTITTSPVRWSRSSWLKAALLSGITVGLYTYDDQIQGWSQRRRSGSSDNISNVAIHFGELQYLAPSLAVSYFTSGLAGNKKLQETSFLGMESLVIANLLTGTLKLTGHRHRPDSGDSHNVWDGPGLTTADDSFPSAHSTSAFAVATVIAVEYGNLPIVPPLVYGMATLTALSRINDNVHWSSDIFVGSALGYLVGRSVLFLNSSNDALSIAPVINSKQLSLMISYRIP